MSSEQQIGGQGVRMAAMKRRAIVEREERVRKAVAAYDAAETVEEMIAAASDLMAVSEAADEAYRQRTRAILALMAEPIPDTAPMRPVCGSSSRPLSWWDA